MSPDYTQNLFEIDDEQPKESVEHVIRVAFDTGADTCFDYAVPPHLWPIEPGQRVELPFGKKNKTVKGFCIEALSPDQVQKSRKFRLKRVKKVIDNVPLIDDQLMQLARWISRYYVCPLGQTLAAMLPAAVKKGIGLKKEKLVYLARTDNEEIENLTSQKQKKIVEILKDQNAVNADTAIVKTILLDAAQCSEAPLKTLLRKEIVKILSREILHSPPAVPQGLTMQTQNVILNDDQKHAVDHLANEIKIPKFGVTLLHGVTASGKTEVYIKAIEQTIAKGRSAIVLLPEIALTTQTINRFSSRFKKIAVMHCQLTASQRHGQWRKIKNSEADVVIGARSAVFAPLSNLGLIVVDEEHEPSYKQDTVPRYHGRDVAIKRAQLANAHCILGSATPSLETLTNCRSREHFSLIELPNRVMDLPMPTMKLVDMRYSRSDTAHNLISEELEKLIHEKLQREEQIILLLNRRGYSNFVFCPSCRHTLHCRNCDVTLTFHKRTLKDTKTPTVLGKHISAGYAICHYCLSKTLVPGSCPLCQSTMTMIGLGSQKLTEELQRKFPDANVLRIDSDTMAGAGPGKYYRMLADFADGKVDILAGTQMLAKGLHFPNVTLVGIISADTALAIPDFRSNERTFQLISQVAGRAGRAQKQGTVIAQTFLPDQPAIRFAMKHDYHGFVNAELEHRQQCNLPPYWRLAIVHLRDEKYEKLTLAAEEMARRIRKIVENSSLQAKIRGPMPSTISRIHAFHRIQIALQAPNADIIGRVFAELRTFSPLRPAVKVAIDVDPINLL